MQIRPVSDDGFTVLPALHNHALDHLTADWTEKIKELNFRSVASGGDRGWARAGIDPGCPDVEHVRV